MRFMVIESFKPGQTEAVYDRFRTRGRLLPPGLEYVSSWLTADRTTCFQLMETNDPQLFAVWIANWDDLTTLEIIELAATPD